MVRRDRGTNTGSRLLTDFTESLNYSFLPSIADPYPKALSIHVTGANDLLLSCHKHLHNAIQFLQRLCPRLFISPEDPSQLHNPRRSQRSRRSVDCKWFLIANAVDESAYAILNRTHRPAFPWTAALSHLTYPSTRKIFCLKPCGSSSLQVARTICPYSLNSRSTTLSARTEAPPSPTMRKLTGHDSNLSSLKKQNACWQSYFSPHRRSSWARLPKRQTALASWILHWMT